MPCCATGLHSRIAAARLGCSGSTAQHIGSNRCGPASIQNVPYPPPAMGSRPSRAPTCREGGGRTRAENGGYANRDTAPMFPIVPERRMIDPRDTRKLLCEFAEMAAPLRNTGVPEFGYRP
jgi:hypothetical protein